MSEEEMRDALVVPHVLRKMMESPVPLDIDKGVFNKFLQQLAAELQPRGMIDLARVVGLAEWEWNSAWLKKCRRLLIERQRGRLMEKEVIELNVPPRRKPTPEELRAAKVVAARHMDELCGVRLDLTQPKLCARWQTTSPKWTS
jgi:hypothetical protein